MAPISIRLFHFTSNSIPHTFVKSLTKEQALKDFKKELGADEKTVKAIISDPSFKIKPIDFEEFMGLVPTVFEATEDISA